jgi:alanine dehydrogenase
MDEIKIGLIREGKNPPDKRVVFTPLQILEIGQRFPHVKVTVQESTHRCFTDDEYRKQSVPVQPDLADCNIIMGIKEVPSTNLIEGKTYLFFSHTMKKQPYNRKLLQEVLSKKIKLIDYEALTDTQGNRLVAFGRYAGMVGAYNALLTYGKRYNAFQLKRAFDCFDVNALKLELRKVTLPPVKIILTGAGRVAKGAMEALDTAGIRKVNPYDFTHSSFEEAVYVQLGSVDYHLRKDGGNFNRDEFHNHPDKYYSIFNNYIHHADILLAGAFWNINAPKLFSREDMLDPAFKIKVIADITCDINGSIPSTKQASTISDPVYDYDPITDSVKPPFSFDSFVTVMAIDNLPCELTRSASEEFGHDIIDRILRPLLVNDSEGIIERATIAKTGKLTKEFSYLQDFING